MTPPSLTEARRAYDLAHYGDASSEAQLAALHELIAAERATETLDERCFRLGLMAADHDHRADDLEAEAAQDELLVVARRARWGEDDAVQTYANRARAGREEAAKQRAEATRLRSQAAALRRAETYAADVIANLQAMSLLTPRQAAEAIEQFGDDLAALNIAFDKLCNRMGAAVDHVNAITDQDKLDTIAEAFRALGDRLCRECDAAEEAEDRRRDNPLEPDFRRLGQ